MLTISEPLSGVGETAGYYVRYYTSKMEGVWLGGGAHLLELDGAVRPFQLRNLLAGLSPDGSRPLVQNAGHRDRQMGWDLTFSAPKSVSVFWAMAPEELRREVERVHQRAVQTTIAFMEKKAGVTRRGKGGRIRENAVLVIAAFQDHVSRELDPQLHTHAVTFNLCVRSDGSTGTIRSKDIFEHKMALGMMYRQALEAGLQELLGMEMRNTKDGFELQGVPENLCEHFSKRRQQIEAELARLNQGTAVEAKAAALRTRSAARAANFAVLFVSWQNIGTSLGWSTAEALQIVNRASQNTEHSTTRKPDFEQAPESSNPKQSGSQQQKDDSARHPETRATGEAPTQNEKPKRRTKSKLGIPNKKEAAESQKQKHAKFRIQAFHVRWWELRGPGRPSVDANGNVHPPKALLKLPYLVLGPKPKPKWGRIYAKLLVGRDSEIRIQYKRLFPRAPSFNPLGRLELPAFRWHLYDDVERLKAAVRSRDQTLSKQKSGANQQEQEQRNGIGR